MLIIRPALRGEELRARPLAPADRTAEVHLEFFRTYDFALLEFMKQAAM
jgi:hypothetical protein